MPRFHIRPLLKVAATAAILLSVAGSAARPQTEPDTVTSLPGIEINTSVDMAEVYIGDLITYTVTIIYDSTYKLEPPPLGANLGAFDVKDYEPDVEVHLDDGRVRSRTTFVLSTFTTGDYTIPPLPVMFELPEGTRQVLLAEPVPIKVLSLLGNAGDSVDIRPLKAQYEFPPDYTPYYLWGGLGLIVLVAAIVAWVIWRRRKKVAEQADLRPPWEIAFERLAYLKEKYLPASESVADEKHKEYYLELTEITRIYLGRVFDTDVPEMTTEQFLESFAQKELPGNLLDQLADFYQHADRVKFARYRPQDSRPMADFNFAHELVETVRDDFERRQQMEVQINGSAGPDQTVPEEQPA